MLLVVAAIIAAILSSPIAEALEARVAQSICAIATEQSLEQGCAEAAPSARARPAPNLYGFEARPSLARMNVGAATPMPLAPRSSQAGALASLKAAERSSTSSFDPYASLAYLGLPPGAAKLRKASARSGEELLPFQKEINALLDEASGAADVERALAAIRERRYGGALLNGVLALPFAKAVKIAKWAGRGVLRAGQWLGRTGQGRALAGRGRELLRRVLREQRGSVGLPRKPAVKAGRGLTEGDRVGIVREAFQRKGNFGLGTATRSESNQLGRDFVGPGFTRSRSQPDILISADGLRKYRPPSFKPGRGGYQANLERRFERHGPFNSNGHLDISDP